MTHSSDLFSLTLKFDIDIQMKLMAEVKSIFWLNKTYLLTMVSWMLM